MTYTCRRLVLMSLLIGLPNFAAGDEEILLPSQPNLSPDGKTLAFAWRGDIWTASSDGGTAQRLTTHEGRDQQPKFSPDGKTIAFVGDRGLGPQLYLVPATGGEPRAATSHTAGYSLEGWYPDGGHLLASGARDYFWRRGERFLRVVASADPAKRRADELVFDDYGTEASLSPDGKQMLFVREGVLWVRKGYVGSQDGQIWLFDTPTKKFTKLLALPGGCRWPLWKPDGMGFYFVSAESGATNLWSYDLKTMARAQLTKFDDDGVVFPTLSRDGSTIVFRRLFSLYKFRPGQDGPPQPIRLMVAADEAVERTRRVMLTKATDAVFIGDGLEVAFIAGGDVWVMDTELREPKQVTDTPEEERDVEFAPDGEALYFVSDRDGRCDVWRAKRKNAARFWWRNDEFSAERLTADEAVESDLQFSPDGSRLAFVRGRGDLWTMDRDGKDAKRIIASWSGIDYDWSPDGKWFAYATDDEDFNGDVWIRPADGSGTPFNVSRHPDNDGAPSWSSDGKVLAFIGRRNREEVDIHYVWLRKQDDEQSTRDRTLETALEKIQKARRKPTPNTSTTSPTTSAATAAPKPAVVKPNDGDQQAAAPATTTASTTTAAATSTSATTAARPTVQIDFDGLHERLRTIAGPNSTEAELVWSPDSKRLAFVAEIKGQKGLFAVGFPSPGAPALIVGETGVSPRWLSEGNQVVWLSQGVPASVATTANRQTAYRFVARHTFDAAKKNAAAFDLCWRTMRDLWYDPRLGNRNWDDVRRKYRDAAERAADELGFSTVVNMMLGELNGSHLGFSPAPIQQPADPTEWQPLTPHLGVRFDAAHKGPGLRIRDVLAKGPADQARSRLSAGEIVLAIDGTTVDPAMDLTQILNGQMGRDIRLKVKALDGKEREVVLRPIPYDVVPKLLYEKWVRDNRRAVETASKGKLGYVHIAGMDEPSLLRFEEELFSAASGKSGLVIDVRENGGGSTTDHLLTMLTQPQHAITVPRGGPQGYPQDRKIYASWNKPIVVMCNQNSFSNAEIFSHSIKTLRRGKIVGVPSAGGVVSTGAVQIMDVGALRLPFRGWFVLETGEDMELNGCVPDEVVWPEPGQMPAGKDVQLEKAIEVLLGDVQAWEARPRPKLRYATER